MAHAPVALDDVPLETSVIFPETLSPFNVSDLLGGVHEEDNLLSWWIQDMQGPSLESLDMYIPPATNNQKQSCRNVGKSSRRGNSTQGRHFAADTVIHSLCQTTS